MSTPDKKEELCSCGEILPDRDYHKCKKHSSPDPFLQKTLAEFDEKFSGELWLSYPSDLDEDGEQTAHRIQLKDFISAALNAQREELTKKIEYEAHFSKLAGSKYDGYIYYKDVLALLSPNNKEESLEQKTAKMIDKVIKEENI